MPINSLPVPSGLVPGDNYRLAFVTSGVRDAVSTEIADYDAFVNSAANAGGSLLAPLGLTWQVIGSTDAVAAFDHIGGFFTDPLYRLDGLKVADGSSTLWDGRIDNGIDIDELGNSGLGLLVWTGTASFEGARDLVLGGTYFNNTSFGFSQITGYGWADTASGDNRHVSHFYGISQTLTVPSVPESETGSVILLGAMFVVVGKRLKNLLTAMIRV